MKGLKSYVLDYSKIKTKKKSLINNDVPSSLTYNPNFSYIHEQPKARITK